MSKRLKNDDQDTGFNQLEHLNRQLEIMAQNAPKGGYLRAIKKRYFRPKTNWSMLATLTALAGLLISVLS